MEHGNCGCEKFGYWNSSPWIEGEFDQKTFSQILNLATLPQLDIGLKILLKIIIILTV